MSRGTALLAALAVSLAAHAQQPAPKPADPEILKALDRGIWQPFVRAYGEHKADDYIALHSRQLVRVSAEQKSIDPYDLWIERTRAMFKSFADRNRRFAIAFRFTERIANADTASERGIFEFSVLAPNAEPRRFYGKFHVLSRKEDGRWKILSDYDSREGGTIDAASFAAAHAPEDYARY
jgi:hypothetical protein